MRYGVLPGLILGDGVKRKMVVWGLGDAKRGPGLVTSKIKILSTPPGTVFKLSMLARGLGALFRTNESI